MFRQYQYGEHRFLVDVVEVADIPSDAEAYELSFPKSTSEPRNFRVELFRVDSSDTLTSLLIADQSEDFRKALDAELTDIGMNMITFVANPYFDEVMIFHGETIITSKDRHAPVNCDQCNRPGLFERREKENKTEYIKTVHAKLHAKSNPQWPFNGNLAIQYSVSDTQSRLNTIDLDNLSKTVCDSLQGVVFTNDNQIVRLAADKDYVGGFIAHVVAIKRLEPGERPIFQEYLFSSRIDAWKDEYAQKRLLKKSTRFESY